MISIDFMNNRYYYLYSVTLAIAHFFVNFPYFTHLPDLWTNKYYKFKINLIDCQLLITYFACKRLQYLQLSKTFYNICSNKNTHLKNLIIYEKLSYHYQTTCGLGSYHWFKFMQHK